MRRPMLPTAVLMLVLCACGGEETTAPPASKPAAAFAPAPPTPRDLDRVLLLSLSVFPEGPDGRASSDPGPATLVIVRREGGRWLYEVLEDPESNVFHKAVPFTPPPLSPLGGKPGLLTISGNGARLKLWRRGPGGWQAETLWAPEFGGEHDRLRDVEVADLDGDGIDEIVLATHDQGVVAVGTFRGAGTTAGGFEVRELDRRRDTFVHEVEVGDTDGDGALEIFATPSQPNRLDGDPQTGEVLRYDPAKPDGGRTVFADLGLRHAKEILAADLDADGIDELYVAVEAHTEGGALVEPVEIRRYAPADSTPGESKLAELEDRFCRVLLAADVDGDGRLELVASPFRSGLWLFRPGADPSAPWEKLQIDADSSGFEHASAAFDLDGDGRDELYVAADDQHALRRYVWTPDGFAREEIYHVPPELRGFTWNVTAAPASLVR